MSRRLAFPMLSISREFHIGHIAVQIIRELDSGCRLPWQIVGGLLLVQVQVFE